MRDIDNKSKIKILTDIRISQSPSWARKTDFIGDINQGLAKYLNKLLDRLPEHLKPFFNSIIIIRNMQRYDVVITANIKTAQLISVFRKLFNIKKTRHIVLELMLDEESQTIKWEIKRLLQRFFLSSIDIIFVSSWSRQVMFAISSNEAIDISGLCCLL